MANTMIGAISETVVVISRVISGAVEREMAPLLM
jgi:hypothetical protein